MAAIPPRTNIDGIKKAAMDGIDGAFERGKKYGRYLALQEYLQQKEESKPKWISVNERLPEAYDDGSVDAVLVTDGSFIHMAYFSGGKWRFCESGEMKEEMFYSVTHWMPLPEPPRRTFSRSLAAKHENEPVRKDG